MNTLKIGEKAPDFKLVTTELKSISLKDFKEKNIVLSFFPLAFTSVCTEQICAARDDSDKYGQLNAEVIGISVDSPFVLKKFGEEHHIDYTLASDFNKTVSAAYGCLFDGDFAGMSGFSKRSAFVIDKEGILRYAEITDGKTLPDFKRILGVLEGLSA